MIGNFQPGFLLPRLMPWKPYTFYVTYSGEGRFHEITLSYTLEETTQGRSFKDEAQHLIDLANQGMREIPDDILFASVKRLFTEAIEKGQESKTLVHSTD